LSELDVCEDEMNSAIIDNFFSRVKLETEVQSSDKDSSKGSNKFSIESILGLNSNKSSSNDDTKINHLELMGISQKGKDFTLQ
jgi:hypothetical protein